MPPKKRRTLGNSPIRKRSVVLAGHKTSISIEDEFWQCLMTMARMRAIPVHVLITELDANRSVGNLSSRIRLWVLEQARLGNLPQDLTE